MSRVGEVVEDSQAQDGVCGREEREIALERVGPAADIQNVCVSSDSSAAPSSSVFVRLYQ